MLRNKFPQINILRLAGLMGGNRLLKNYKVSNQTQPVNHIHYVDICRIISRMIALKIHSKTYNLVVPIHPTKEEIIDTQNGKIATEYQKTDGKIILSDDLVSDLDYTFVYPNPKYFHI